MLNWEQEINTIICPCCNSQSWAKFSKHNKRYNSTTTTITCSHCKKKLFLKKINITPHINNYRHEAQEQFDTLSKIYEKFPTTAHFSTLVPVHINQNGGWFATEFISGSTLGHYLVNTKSDQIQNTLFQTGRWLRLLHLAGGNNVETPNLIADKQQAIQKMWSNHKPPASVLNSISSLNKATNRLKIKKFNTYWLHGDFSPDNILFDKQRLTGIDIGWRAQGIAEMDLAPFLNHLYFICNSFRGRHLKKLVPDLESAFLSGYFNSEEHDGLLLNWSRLYFLLSYWASAYNSLLKRVYSNIEFSSITEKITDELNIYVQKKLN